MKTFVDYYRPESERADKFMHDEEVWKAQVEDMLNDLTKNQDELEKRIEHLETTESSRLERIEKKIEFIMENTFQDRIKTVDGWNVENKTLKELFNSK